MRQHQPLIVIFYCLNPNQEITQGLFDLAAYDAPFSRNLALARTRRSPLIVELCPTIKMSKLLHEQKNTNNSITLTAWTLPQTSSSPKFTFAASSCRFGPLSALVGTIASQNRTSPDLLTQPRMVVGRTPFTPSCHS